MIEIWNTPSGRILFLGITLELFLIGILAIGDLRQTIPTFLLLYFSAFLVYLGAVYCGYRMPGNQAGNYEFVVLIVGFAILFRVTLFFSAPSLSCSCGSPDIKSL